MGIYQNLSGECRPAFAIFLSLSPQTRFQHFCNAFLQRRLHNKWVPWLVPRLWDVPKAYDSYDGIVSQKLKPIPPSDPMPGKSICSDSHRSWSFWYKQNSQRNCCNWKHGSWQGRPGYPTKIGFPCFFLLATSLSTTPELLYTLSSSSFFRPQDGLGSAPLYDILLLRYLELSRINLS